MENLVILENSANFNPRDIDEIQLRVCWKHLPIEITSRHPIFPSLWCIRIIKKRASVELL